jgi:spermidine/putrescine transport system permease protein
VTTLATRPTTATRKPSRKPRGPLVWLRAHIIQILAFGAFVYLLLPNLVVIIFSFNKPNGRYNLTFQQFSLDAWLHPCGAPGICESVSLSLKIGLLATLVATILGTMIAFAIVRHRFLGRSSSNLLIFMPMATPEVVMGSSLLTLFVGPLHVVPLGLKTILIAHIMFCISFVVVTVKARLAGLDPRLEQAAMDLYANEYQTFRRITLPLVAPGIAAAALLSFSLSFDDYIITSFNASPSTQTFPMFVWGASTRGTPVQINVIGTIMFVVSLLAVGGAQVLAFRRSRRRAS